MGLFHRTSEAERARSAWQAERDELARLLSEARNVGSAHLTPPGDLVVRQGETLIGAVRGTSLVEVRSVGGHYQSGWSGVSIPVGPLSYRVGRTRGHYVKGAPTPVAVDTGMLYVTDQRVVFVGAAHTRECAWDKIVSLHRSPEGELSIGLEGHERDVIVFYGRAVAGYVDYCVDFAQARHHGQGDQFVAALVARLDEIDRRKPAAT